MKKFNAQDMTDTELASIQEWAKSIGHDPALFSGKFEVVDTLTHRTVILHRHLRDEDGRYIFTADYDAIATEPVEVDLDGPFPPDWLTEIEERVGADTPSTSQTE